MRGKLSQKDFSIPIWPGRGNNKNAFHRPHHPHCRREQSVGAGWLTARGEAGKPGALGLLLELSPGAAGELGTRTWIGIWTELGAVLAPDAELGAEMMLQVLTRAREHLTSCPGIPAAQGSGMSPECWQSWVHCSWQERGHLGLGDVSFLRGSAGEPVSGVGRKEGRGEERGESHSPFGHELWTGLRAWPETCSQHRADLGCPWPHGVLLSPPLQAARGCPEAGGGPRPLLGGLGSVRGGRSWRIRRVRVGSRGQIPGADPGSVWQHRAAGALPAAGPSGKSLPQG